LSLVATNNSGSYTAVEGEDGQPEYWRVLLGIEGSKSIDKAETPEQIEQVARAFGRFIGLADGFPAEELTEVIPNFHNTPDRFRLLEESHKSSTLPERLGESAELYNLIKGRKDRTHLITDLLESKKIKTRVAHNDTKANNALLDAITGEALAAVDYDTIGPSSVLYDFGDGARSGCNNGLEDDKDLDNVFIREDLFKGWAKGYLRGVDESHGELTEAELDHLVDGVEVMCLELSMRFLTDYLNGDAYFGGDYENRPDLNLERAKAQFKLMQSVVDNRDRLQEIVFKAAQELSEDRT